MSYRNPQQTLNRSAGKLYGDVAQSITSGMQQLSSAYRVDQAAVKRNRDEINAMIEKANNQKILFDTTLNQAYQDAGVWFDQENKDRLSEEANQVSLLMQKSVKTPEEMQRISNFMGSADVTKKDFETFGTLLSTLQNDLKNGGKEGGVSNSQYSDRLKRARAFAGLDGGKVTVNTDLSQAGGPNNMYTWTSDDGKTTYTMDSKELRNIESKPGLGMYNVIPQYTETFTGFGNEAIKSLGSKANYTNAVAVETKDTKGNVIKTEYIRKFNEKGFYDAIKPQMQAQAEAYINSDAQSFVTMYNHMIARNPEKFSNVEEISPAIDIKKINELKPKLVEMMSYNALKLQGNKDIITATTTPSEPSDNDGGAGTLDTVERVKEIFVPTMNNLGGRNAEYFNKQKYSNGEISEASFQERVWDEKDEVWKTVESVPEYAPSNLTPVLTFTLKEVSGDRIIATPITINLENMKDTKVFLEDLARGKYGKDALTKKTFSIFTELLNQSDEEKAKPKEEKAKPTPEELYNNYLSGGF